MATPTPSVSCAIAAMSPLNSDRLRGTFRATTTITAQTRATAAATAMCMVVRRNLLLILSAFHIPIFFRLIVTPFQDHLLSFSGQYFQFSRHLFSQLAEFLFTGLLFENIFKRPMRQNLQNAPFESLAKPILHLKFRVSARNNYTRLRRILVRLQGTSAGAYRDMCWWM